jgi:hypothetical protein
MVLIIILKINLPPNGASGRIHFLNEGQQYGNAQAKDPHAHANSDDLHTQ